MSGTSNGCIRKSRSKSQCYISSAIMTVQEELLTSGTRDGLATEASLQVILLLLNSLVRMSI